VRVEWNTALAGRDPLQTYDIYAGSRRLLSLPARPQLTEVPLTAVLPASAVGEDAVRVVAT